MGGNQRAAICRAVVQSLVWGHARAVGSLHWRAAKGLPAHHEAMLLLLYVCDRVRESLLDSHSQVLELVQIVAHLLLALQLLAHHARFQLLLLLECARLARFSRLLEEA